MKKLLFLLLPIILISCEARLDDDKRAFFKTRIVDSNGLPLRNALVEVTTYRSYDFFLINGQNLAKTSEPDRDFLLGKGTTDENGEVSFTMLFDTTYRYYVHIKGVDDSSKILAVAGDSFNDDLTLDIPLITMTDIANVELEFINTSGTASVYEVSVNYFAVYCDELYENNSFVRDERCEFEDEIFDVVNQTTDDGLFEFRAFYPSVMDVNYRDVAGNDVNEQFTINNPTERYEINY